MIRLLSALSSLLTGTTLARTVLRLAREHDSLSSLCVELQSALDAAQDREQAARAYARRWKDAARSLRLARDTLAARARDAIDTGELVAATLTTLQAEHARLSKAWGEAVRAREALEGKLKTEEARTSVLRAEIASLRREEARAAE